MDRQRDEETPVIAATQPQPLPAGGASLEDLYREHHARVMQAAYRITGDASEAEDVLQTVFLRLATRDEVPDLSPSPGAYFHRAAVNAALDMVRNKKRRPTSAEAFLAFVEDDATPGPDARHRETELRLWLRDAIARLSPQAAEVLVLSAVEGLANHEIADALGTSRNTVGVLLHRARKQLRADLQSRQGGRT